MPAYISSIFRSTLVTACAFLLASCDKPVVNHSASLEKSALMQLPFPGWNEQDSARIQTVDLSATAPKESKAEAASTRAEVIPLYVVELDDTHAALVTQTSPVDERDEPFDCHACSLSVGAYFFEHDSAGWRLTARQDAAVASGLQGEMGTTQISKLADGHYALTSEWGSCWQGYCGTWLVVLGLQAGKATPLSDGIATSVDNDGAHGSCSALDEPQNADQDALTHDCMDIQGKWEFAGDHLLMNFTGRLREVDDKGKPQPTLEIAQSAEYEIAQGKLKLTKGSNPVPSF